MDPHRLHAFDRCILALHPDELVQVNVFRTIAVILGCCILLDAGASSWPVEGVTLFVSPIGNDSWSGTSQSPNEQQTDGPFATIERARDEIRRKKNLGVLPASGTSVEISGGVYQLDQPFTLTEEDSGSVTAPILYQARIGDDVRLVGGPTLSPALFKPVTAPDILRRLDPAAHNKVLQFDLHKLGRDDLSPLKEGIGGDEPDPGVQLFFKNEPMTLARWPNESAVTIQNTLNVKPINIRGIKGDGGGQFIYKGHRPARWVGEPNIWLHGYWFWDWSDERVRVKSISPDKHVITIASPQHRYGYRKGQPYYAVNILSELDSPGEWYIDRGTSILYFWPPSNITDGTTQLSWIPNIVSINGASHLRLHGMTMEAARQTAVVINGAVDVRLSACTIRNSGGSGVLIGLGSSNSGVAGCDLYNLGDDGIRLSGGDRKTLTSAKLYADNNHIHHYSRWNHSYKPAIWADGVGATITHNLIHDAPHQAIGFAGNDHIIGFNEIYRVCTQSNDAGAVYAGRDWSMRGTVIRNNYFHDIYGLGGRGAVAVYLDDMLSGINIENNIFWNTQKMAVQLGGGHDNKVRNNIFVGAELAVATDARGLGWARGSFDAMQKSLAAVPYRESPWRERYPSLLTILRDEPMAPKGTVIERNIFVGASTVQNMIAADARPFVTVKGNLENADPLFVDAAHGDFRLTPESPALRNGFEPIPIEQIGLYLSADRPSGAAILSEPDGAP